MYLQGRRYIKIKKSKYKKKLNAKNFISFYKSFNLLTRDFNLNKKEEELILSYYSIEKFATLLAYNSLFNDWHSTNQFFQNKFKIIYQEKLNQYRLISWAHIIGIILVELKI